MNKGQGFRMQHTPLRTATADKAPALLKIAQNRMSHAAQMHPNLMGAPCDGLANEQRGIRSDLLALPLRSCVLPFFWGHDPPQRLSCIAMQFTQIIINDTRFVRWNAIDNC